MTASKSHWRRLVGGVLALMAIALIAPRFSPGPEIQENRRLAVRPHWDGFSNLTAFRKATDAYVADRFPARRHLISALNRVRMMVGVSGSPKVIVGRDGWLFYDDGSQLGGVRGAPAWGRERTRDWLSVMAGRTEFLRARGVPYLVLVAPLKETVYPQFGPWWLKGPAPNHAALRMPPLVEGSGAGVLISPSRALDAAREAGQPVYSRHDTHWTGYGAYVGYAALMSRLHAMGLTEPPRPRSDFPRAEALPVSETPRDLAKMLGVATYVTIDYPQLYDPADVRRAKVVWLTGVKHWSKPHIIETGVPGKPVLLITVDSFSNALLPLMYRHFSRIIVTHNEEGDWREDLIARYHPDIVILEVVEGGLKFSMSDGGPAPSAAALARIEAALPVEGEGLTALAPAAWTQRKRFAGSHHAGRCNVEKASLRPVDSGPGAGRQWVVSVQGWHAGGAPRGLIRFFGPGGDFAAPIAFDGVRNDVAVVLKRPDMSASGFDQAFVINAPPPGDYAVSLYRPDTKGAAWVECRSGDAFKIVWNSP